MTKTKLSYLLRCRVSNTIRVVDRSLVKRQTFLCTNRYVINYLWQIALSMSIFLHFGYSGNTLNTSSRVSVVLKIRLISVHISTDDNLI